MANAPEIKFEVLRMPPENTNSVLVCRGDECVIFDAWGRGEDWEKLLTSRGLRLRAIYSTHGHPDHISAAPDLAKKYGVPWYLNTDDHELIGWGEQILDMFGLAHINRDVAPTGLDAGVHEVMTGLSMQAVATPGHTPGGMTFLFPDFHILLTGDTLFRDGFGRYDFPGGDANALQRSISSIYNMNLADDTYVVHGHGLDSTIEILKKENPWFK